MSTHRLWTCVLIAALLTFFGAATTPAWAQSMPVMEAVIGNNFGHLPTWRR